MKPSRAVALILAYVKADEPVFVKGPPGIGKSQIAAAVAQALEYRLIDFRALLRDPVDLRGIPVPCLTTGKTIWLQPSDLPFLPYDGPPCLILIDEINTASPAMQNACLGLVLDRRIGEHILDPRTRIIAAGNLGRADGTTVNKMSEALISRFAVLELSPDVNCWREHGRKSGYAAIVTDFIGYRPECLFSMAPQSNGKRPDPRAWERVSNILPTLSDDIRRDAIAGIIGCDTADEFEAFRDVYTSLVPPEKLIADPDNSPVPGLDKPALCYAVSFAVARLATRKNFADVLRYVARLPAEFQVVAVKDAIARDATLKETATFVHWATVNQEILL